MTQLANPLQIVRRPSQHNLALDRLSSEEDCYIKLNLETSINVDFYQGRGHI